MSGNVKMSDEIKLEFPEDKDAAKKTHREENHLAQRRAALLKTKRQEYMGPEKFAAWSTRRAAAKKKKKEKRNRGMPGHPKPAHQPPAVGPHNLRNRAMRDNWKQKLLDVMASAHPKQHKHNSGSKYCYFINSENIEKRTTHPADCLQVFFFDKCPKSL